MLSFVLNTVLKYGLKIEGVVLHRVGILGYFRPKQGQGFKPPAVPLYPNMGQVPHPPPPPGFRPLSLGYFGSHVGQPN